MKLICLITWQQGSDSASSHEVALIKLVYSFAKVIPNYYNAHSYY